MCERQRLVVATARCKTLAVFVSNGFAEIPHFQAGLTRERAAQIDVDPAPTATARHCTLQQDFDEHFQPSRVHRRRKTLRQGGVEAEARALAAQAADNPLHDWYEIHALRLDSGWRRAVQRVDLARELLETSTGNARGNRGATELGRTGPPLHVTNALTGPTHIARKLRDARLKFIETLPR
jgi:hypothetical protein